MDNIFIFNRIHDTDDSFFNNPYKSLSLADYKLLNASKTGNLSEVINLFGQGADIKATNSFGNTPLTFACEEGHTDIVAFLLQHGADINAISVSGNTPLMTACLYGHTDTVAFLLQHGADIKATNVFGSDALVLACQTDKTDIAYLLLNWMTPEEREAFANKNDANVEIVYRFKKNLDENNSVVYNEIYKPQKVNLPDLQSSIFQILPFELKCIIRYLEVKLKLKETFKNSWFRFSAFESMDKQISPVLFLSNHKRKVESDPEENNRPNKKICLTEKMETDEAHESITFSKNK